MTSMTQGLVIPSVMFRIAKNSRQTTQHCLSHDEPSLSPLLTFVEDFKDVSFELKDTFRLGVLFAVRMVILLRLKAVFALMVHF